MFPVNIDAVVAAHIVVDCADKCSVVVAIPEVRNRLPFIVLETRILIFKGNILVALQYKRTF